MPIFNIFVVLCGRALACPLNNSLGNWVSSYTEAVMLLVN